MKKFILPVIITSALTSVLAFWGLGQLSENNIFLPNNSSVPVHYASYTGATSTQPVDFTEAAESSVKSVVHIMTVIEGRTVIAQNPFNPFSGRRYQVPNQMGSGSGVIISDDGYIVTNNHVVQGADKVQVTFNNRNTQIAKVIGTDPATDLAVLKIEGKNFPFMTLGNSDDVKLGQWVLAIGYPLNLDATVTAGIVSAKSRSLGVNRKNSENAIESFIQTDAAVNPGNSGGALVNTAGLLIGINSAIATPTGSYAGYSYAIPSNIVHKIAQDIIQYGSVQRGYLGIHPIDLNDLDMKTASQLGLSADDFKNSRGVFVYEVMPNTGAAKSDLKKGDFITAINNVATNSVPELLEQIAKYNPGDILTISYLRNNKTYTTKVELRNLDGTTDIIKPSTVAEKASAVGLGAEVRDLKPGEFETYNLNGGVYINKIKDGLLANQTNIKPGFVIFSVNDQAVQNVSELKEALNNAGKRLQIAGKYPNQNGIYYYGVTKE